MGYFARRGSKLRELAEHVTGGIIPALPITHAMRFLIEEQPP